MARGAKKNFRFLEHTADIMLEADGKDYLDALQNAALGMFSVLGPAKPEVKFTIEEKAHGKDELVVYVLSRILAECDAREIVPAKTRVLSFDGTSCSIRMEVSGEKKRARDHIKAVTFHELSLVEDGKGSRIRVLFDV
jgi:SHS2 domain-containing protein